MIGKDHNLEYCKLQQETKLRVVVALVYSMLELCSASILVYSADVDHLCRVEVRKA